MKTAEIKKCEKKISNLYRIISTKEKEKIDLSKNIHSLVQELKNLKKRQDQIRLEINKVNNEIQKIRENRTKTDQEMFKIRTSLPYRTKNQYSDMIAQLENEMRLNKNYKPNEEARLLKDISHYQQCFRQFELYEEKQADIENLKRTSNEKKIEYESLWNESKQIGEQFTTKNENLTKLKSKKIIVKDDLSMLHQQVLDAKKELEDLKREKIINEKFECYSKDENAKNILEQDLKTIKKLINYFTRFQCPQASFSLNCSGEIDLNDNQPELPLTKPTSLDLRKLAHKSEDFTGTPSPISLLQSSTYPLLYTPTSIEEKCPEGMFLLKKKTNDDQIECKNWKKKLSKKIKINGTQKCSHSVEIINLLDKFKIPLNLCSQVDECIRELNGRCAELEEKIKLQDSEKNTCNEACASIDNQSVISSLMDSNYESDTNSFCTAGIINDQTLTANDFLELDLANLPNSLDSSTKSTSSSSSDKTLKLSPKLVLKNIFLRQESDGYSSNCLSADSMSSEIQADGKKDEANPFFKQNLNI